MMKDMVMRERASVDTLFLCLRRNIAEYTWLFTEVNMFPHLASRVSMRGMAIKAKKTNNSLPSHLIG